MANDTKYGVADDRMADETQPIGMKLHLTPPKLLREKYPTDLFSERVKDERHLRREQSFLEIRN